ncbi:MAG TPA: L-aspartate oxidase [Ignavibacteria bacterium]|nr:L-aspartate oxidase [Ignavibacteria bacterium]
MTTDFLIIGSGIAGLSLALKLSAFGKVIVITKKQKSESNTNYAQGGIAAVMSDDDNFELHINDTLDCGAGLCDIKAVRKIVEEGPDMIRELTEFGAKFSNDKGTLLLGKEGGHSKNRIIHAKDLTGKEIERALLSQISKNKKIRLFEYYFAVDLLTNKNLKKKKDKEQRCYGIYALNVKTDKVEKIAAKKTILATGGAGQIYLHTTNPAIATGDGIAMGFRAGCEIANMEFIQFHPTALYDPESDDNFNNNGQVFLISEAVRGAGAVLKTNRGKEFMKKYDKRGSLAPRDIVARAIDNEMKKSGDTHVMLDLSNVGKEKILKEFPNIYKYCLTKGIDITKQMIPVVPAAHYTCGGLKTDLRGRTSLTDLYASGEVTMTGVHGANRLASNSLLEAMVFSNAIYEDIKNIYQNSDKKVFKNLTDKEYPAKLKDNIYDWDDDGMENTDEWILISHNKKEIKEVMSDYVGIVRNMLRLERAYRRIKMMREEIKEFYDKTKVNVDLLELRNMVTVAYLVIQSAMLRKESRGLHFMSDFLQKDDKNFLNDTIIVKDQYL